VGDVKPYLLNAVPEALWLALREDAASREVPDKFHTERSGAFPVKRQERTGTSLNNVVCEILAARYGLTFSSTNRPTYDQESPRRRLYLRVPEVIFDEVREEAGVGSVRGVILTALSDHGRPRGRKAKR
jgi:hypothetical protein